MLFVHNEHYILFIILVTKNNFIWNIYFELIIYLFKLFK